MIRPLPILLLALACTGCKSGPPNLQREYERTLEDFESHDGSGGLRKGVVEKQVKRYEKVAKWNQEGRIRTAEQHLYAAGILVTSDLYGDLVLARSLAQEAAELGDERGFAVLAEAVDKLLLKEGRPQRYGTQYVWEPVLQKWRLYAVDPLTTDAVRRAMGVPVLAELQAGVDVLNSGKTTKVLRGIH